MRFRLLLDEWRRQGHSRRTQSAWVCGVRLAALGRSLRVYDDSPSDFAIAERAGRRAAMECIANGGFWECVSCQSTFPLPEPTEVEKAREALFQEVLTIHRTLRSHAIRGLALGDAMLRYFHVDTEERERQATLMAAEQAEADAGVLSE